MNPGINQLQPYPFEKLSRLKESRPLESGKLAIDLSIGEPKHETPRFILDTLYKHLIESSNYPKTHGQDELRAAISSWMVRRFKLPDNSLHPDHHILPVNGTREALFAFAQCMIDSGGSKPLVAMPNPFYQIYEGAALLAGATPHYLNCLGDNRYIPDFGSVPTDIWKNCQLVYICTPGNPTGSVMDQEHLVQLMDLADRYEFIIASDECYSEIYFDENSPPIGLLQAAANSGRDDFRRCIVFHSLSKRSNVPGMRSGFIAGDQQLVNTFLRYRTYHGCAMPGFVQAASIAAWNDEKHVIENRALYREKFKLVLDILQPVLKVIMPDAGFYLWPKVPISDTMFAGELYASQNVTTLPGSYLSRTVDGINPGENRLRVALVPALQECIESARRIREYIEK